MLPFGPISGTCLFGLHQDAAPNAINDYYGWANTCSRMSRTPGLLLSSTQPTTCTSGSGAARITNAYGYNYDGCYGRSRATVQYPSDQMMFMDMQDSFVISSTNTYKLHERDGQWAHAHSDGANVALWMA